PDLNHDRPFLDGVGPDHRAFDRRRRRLQPRQTNADQDDRQQSDAGIDRLFNPLLLRIGRTRNIHGCCVCLDGNKKKNDQNLEGANGAPFGSSAVSDYTATTYRDAKREAIAEKVSARGTARSQERLVAPENREESVDDGRIELRER